MAGSITSALRPGRARAGHERLLGRAFEERSICLKRYQPGEQRAPRLESESRDDALATGIDPGRLSDVVPQPVRMEMRAVQRVRKRRPKPGGGSSTAVGLLGIDRVKRTSSLKEAERRKLAAILDRALTLAVRGKLHLFRERNGDGDGLYWAVARAPGRSIEKVPSRFSIDQRSEHLRR